jgi:outer membrane lipoprotein SlyB
MRTILAFALLGAACAWAQPPAPPATPPTKGPCADCGVVRSIRSVSKELPPTPTDETKPSGLVATVPLGGGKVRTGSSTHIGKDVPNVLRRWEVIVRLDDGRARVLMMDNQPGDVHVGDRVMVQDGRVVPAPH